MDEEQKIVRIPDEERSIINPDFYKQLRWIIPIAIIVLIAGLTLD